MARRGARELTAHWPDSSSVGAAAVPAGPQGSLTPTLPTPMIPRRIVSPSRWTWALPLVAVAFVVACEDSLSVNTQDDTWGFINIAARKTAGGVHYTRPDAFFFKARLAGVPNASFAVDSCNDVAYTPENDLSGVTYLDAGEGLPFRLAGREDTLRRILTAASTTYELGGGSAPFNYTPGDSVVVKVPGSIGGFPAAEIRAKTAEAFTMDPVAAPGGSAAIQLRWTAAHNLESAMVLSLRYASSTSGGQFNRQVLCTYQDDGIDSIPFRQYQTWSSASGTKEVVATRLRTTFLAAGDAVLEVISTYQVPTPP